MSSHKLSLTVVLLVAALLPSQGVDQINSSEGSRGQRKPVERLIEELADEDFKVRQAAARELVERDDALPALETALKSSEAEVRRHAEVIIGELRARKTKQAVRTMLASAHDGEIDYFIDLFVGVKASVDDQGWAAAIELTKSLTGRSARVSGREIPLPNRDFMKCQALIAGSVDGVNLLADHRISAESVYSKGLVGDCLIVCRDVLETPSQIVGTVLYCNGDVKVGAQIHNCVIFCDGNIEVRAFVNETLLVATGTVRVHHQVKDSVIFAKGPIRVGAFALNSVIQTGDSLSVDGFARKCKIQAKAVEVQADRRESNIEEKEENPLQFLKLFDVGKAGIEVADSKTEVKFEKVHADKPFAKAGVQKGDLVLAVGDKEIKGYDDFRKAVRRNFVDKAEPVFKVKRGEQTLDLKVSFKE